MSETSFPKVELCQNYRCCKCGRMYPSVKLAEKCFDSHARAIEIVNENTDYVQGDDPDDICNYPKSLQIRFSNDQLQIYHLLGGRRI